MRSFFCCLSKVFSPKCGIHVINTRFVLDGLSITTGCAASQFSNASDSVRVITFEISNNAMLFLNIVKAVNKSALILLS
uniref:Uncharacterized protein n=1 Tax=Choristoneura fumiferana nuclear polyhedrosis virus TaxID=208973 RepID=Q6LCD0_NPVCF|nr:unknown [Choristoneura fumiferana multiple nucleopolyhedrovirus]